MTIPGRADQAVSIPASRKALCVCYGLIAVAAFAATWSQNLEYFDRPAQFLHDFTRDARVTPASRSLTADLLLLALAVIILMVLEARKHGIKFVWLYVAAGLAVAISVSFPLFLIARELRIDATEAPRLRALDTILLTGFAILTAALTIWGDLG